MRSCSSPRPLLSLSLPFFLEAVRKAWDLVCGKANPADFDSLDMIQRYPLIDLCFGPTTPYFGVFSDLA